MTQQKTGAEKIDGEKKHGIVQLRCEIRQKSGWVKTAQSEGLSLSNWIIKTLNGASKF
jgi:hypothetical protein